MKNAKIITTTLSPTDSLPLTCSRTGTCCHGKTVWLNPWELARLAQAKGQTLRAFRDQHCNYGGIQLAFTGPVGWKDHTACSMYTPDFGCSVHEGRPLACRLYPLGRQKQGDTVEYIHHGTEFPCMDGCPEVVDLPSLTVAEYIDGQHAGLCEKGQDEYLELMQQLADGAFALLLESGLSESGDTLTLKTWKIMGQEIPEALTKRLGPEWLDRLMIPESTTSIENPTAFCNTHYDALQEHAQESFGSLDSIEAFKNASIVMMGLALHLGRGLGANPADLATHWIRTAKEHGAKDT